MTICQDYDHLLKPWPSSKTMTMTQNHRWSKIFPIIRRVAAAVWALKWIGPNSWRRPWKVVKAPDIGRPWNMGEFVNLFKQKIRWSSNVLYSRFSIKHRSLSVIDTITYNPIVRSVTILRTISSITTSTGWRLAMVFEDEASRTFDTSLAIRMSRDGRVWPELTQNTMTRLTISVNPIDLVILWMNSV